jgi:hypothetical protein
MTGQSFGTNIDNKTTTANVKARLAADQPRSLTWVDVDTNAGTVYLSGTTTSQDDKRRAEQIAQSVDGVQRVVNNIQVRSTTAPAAGTSQSHAAASRSQTGTASGSGSVSASPPTSSGTQRLTGEVTSVDAATGQLILRTTDGQLRNVSPGDRVTIEIGTR